MDLRGRQHKDIKQQAQEGKDGDLVELTAAAVQRIDSRTVVVPTASRKNIQEVDVRKLTKSQRNRILEQGLQVTKEHAATVAACSGCKAAFLAQHL